MNINNIRTEVNGNFAKVLEEFYLWTDLEDQHVGGNCRLRGIWEPDVTEWMVNNIKPNWKCLDIGFNIGYFSELLGRLVGPYGKITAFEPNKFLIEKYYEAVKLNDYTNCAKIKVFPYGLSDENIKAELIIPSDNPGGAGISKTSQDVSSVYTAQAIDIKRLDTVFNDSVDFIKMDIEGGEEMAWNAFPDIVRECPLMVIELGPYHTRSFLEELYSKYTMTTTYYQEITVDQILAHPHHINVVLTKR